jgi:RND family efflux transporter MFP subunit
MKTINSCLTALLSGWLISGCADAQGTEPKPPRPVRAQAVVLSAPSAALRYSAAIEPFEQVSLAFKSSGYVDELLRRPGADGRLRAAQQGDVVAKGAVLARVRDQEYRERVNQGRSRVSEAEVALEKARLDLERARTLFAAASLTKPELDAAQAAFDTSQARLAGTRADLELGESALRDTALVATATGTLLERRVEVGSLAGAGTVAFVLGDISSVKARFGIPDTLVGAVVPGERIELVVEAVAGTAFDGRITSVAPAADPQSRVFDVEVTIPNGDGRLRPGMIGTVSVPPSGDASANPVRPVPTLPLAAIVRSATGQHEYGTFTVERQGDTEIARMRLVKLGDVAGNAIEVVSGLAAGEQVIVTGASLLVDGDTVRVIP